LLERHGGGNYKVLAGVPIGLRLQCTFSTRLIAVVTEARPAGHDRLVTKAPLERELSIDLPGIRRLKLAINSSRKRGKAAFREKFNG
jgi:hypothetical protein